MYKLKGFLMIGILTICLLVTGCSKNVIPTDTSSLVTDINDIILPENIKIVGLGEASHGVSEYQIMKADVFKALVANHDCNTFIIEGDFGGALKVEQYIQGGSGTAEEVVGEIGFAIYRTKEMADLVAWMREYNDQVSEDERLHFYGMDMQRYDNNKEYLFQVLDAGAPEISLTYQEALRSLTDDNRLSLDKATIEQSEKDILELLEIMDGQKEQIVDVVGKEDFEFAKECAKSIYQCSKLVASNSDYNTLRDGYMAEKVDWFVEHGDGSMIFINGHNSHIGKVSAYGYTCLGKHLTDEYGDDYFSIGTDAMHTRFNSQQEDDFVEMEVKSSNNLTKITDSLDLSYFYLAFSDVKDNEEWKSIITKPQRMTALNVGISKWQEKISAYYSKKVTPMETYDGVIIFYDVTPTTLKTGILDYKS